MKQINLKFVCTALCLIMGMRTMAQTVVTINGLKYVLNGTEAYVCGYEGSPTDVVIPATIESDGLTFKVTKISPIAFQNCTTITSAKSLGENLITISTGSDANKGAFSGCTSLVSIIFPYVQTIGSSAFSDCSKLQNVWLGYNLKEILGEFIYSSAFRNCTMLSSIIIPASCTKIGAMTFSGCSRLQTIIYLGTQTSNGGSNAAVYNTNNMVTWGENTFTYTGKKPTATFTNNLPMVFQPKNGSYLNMQEKNVGSYNTIVPITFANSNQEFIVDIPYSYTITPAQLTARVKNATRLYGDPNPQFVTEYTGFVSGENASVITSQGTYTTTATQKSNVGTYEVKLQGASAKNYTFQYESGSLTVTKAPLTITPRDKTMTYGDRLPNLDVDYAGLKNSESKPVWVTEPAITTTATQESAAGSYTINVNGGEAKNYNLTRNQGTLTINKASLIATTKNATRPYGDENPDFELSYSGLKNAETEPAWSVFPKFVIAATKTSPVGTYDITATSGEARNYHVEFVNTGKLTITKAPLTAKARSYTKKQGEENPTFAVDYTGFKNSETKLALTQEPIATTTANRNSQPGTYPITLSGGVAINYELSYVDGTLTILPNDNPGIMTDNVLTIDNVVGNKDAQVMLPVGLTNKQSITGIQFDIYLPDGVTIATDARGKMQIKTTSRMDGTYTVMGSQMEGFTRVVGFSADTDSFLGNSGDILNITLNVGANVAEGNYTIRIKDIVLSDINNTEYHPADVGAVLTIKSYTLGDVDNSGAVNINDVVCIINYILNMTNGTFIEEAADVDGSGAININDVVTLINRYILHRTNAPKRAPKVATDAVGITDRLYIDDISIEQGDTMEIIVQLDNVDEVRAVQGNIKLPAGLKFVTRANGRLDVHNLEERSEDFTLSCALQEDGSMTFAHYSSYGFPYEGNNGGIFSFKIEADKDTEPGEYQVDMKDVVISVKGVGYDMPALSSILIVKESGQNPDGIGSVFSFGLYDIYTVSGAKVRSQATTTIDLPSGIYIVNGRKVLIK